RHQSGPGPGDSQIEAARRSDREGDGQGSLVKPPSEGDLIEIDDIATAGHEQKGRRPALVVSIPEFQDTGFALVCPVTTHGGTAAKPRSDLEVAIPPGFAVSGVILSHHLRSID